MTLALSIHIDSCGGSRPPRPTGACADPCEHHPSTGTPRFHGFGFCQRLRARRDHQLQGQPQEPGSGLHTMRSFFPFSFLFLLESYLPLPLARIRLRTKKRQRMSWRCEGLLPVVPFTWDGTLMGEPGGKGRRRLVPKQRDREQEEHLCSFDFVMLPSTLLCERGRPKL